MSATAPTNIDALPAAPDPSDRPTFNTKAYTWSAALPTFRTQANALGTNVYNNAVEAAAQATIATTQAGLATTNGAAQVALATTQAQLAANSATAAATTANAAAWVNGGTYALNANAISQLDFQTYRKKTASSVTTIDPKNDSTNWVKVGTPTAMVLLATLTPTVAANLDFLTTFSSTYDQYLIMADGLTPSVDDSLSIRFAVSGSADSDSHYYQFSTFNNSNAVTPYTALPMTNTIYALGKGVGFVATVQNANSASGLKTLMSHSLGHGDSTPTYRAQSKSCVYVDANAITGFRLYWSGGANFAATGMVRVYGYANN